MKKSIVTMLTVLVGIVLSNAQEKGDHFWLLGYSSNTSDSSFGGTDIDFNFQPPLVKYHYRPMNFDVTNASICNDEGNLLFYTNGVFIANNADQIMENGDSINAGPIADDFGSSGYRIPQGAIILKEPGAESIYYLVHLKAEYNPSPPPFALCKEINFSLIDMAGANGLGAVIQKNQVIFTDSSLMQGHLTAIRHGNGREWWVIMPKLLSNRYYKLLLTPDGFQGPSQQEIGGFTTNVNLEGGGQAVFTPDGSRYVRFTIRNGTYIFDFDRCTGEFSNYVHIPSLEESQLGGGAAISPNSRFLYISYPKNVYQFDLWADDIAASGVKVAEYDGYVSPFASRFYMGQLAPDGKIYWSCTNSVNVMHVIEHPDEKGLDCGFVQHGVQLPTYLAFGIPNFPNYRLYDLEGSPCDTLGIDTPTAAWEVKEDMDAEIVAYPNPAQGLLFVRTNAPLAQKLFLKVFDGTGRMVKSSVLVAGETAISLAGFENGIYFWTVGSEDSTVRKSGKVIVQR